MMFSLFKRRVNKPSNLVRISVRGGNGFCRIER